IVVGGFVAARWSRREKIDVFHARAHLAMAMAMIARWMVKGKIVFDLRGLVADEYVDAGIWSEGSLVFRFFKWFERRAIRRADQIVVLTKRMHHFLVERGLADVNRIEIIPCCVDLSRFPGESPIDVPPVIKSARFTLIYAGSVTGLYLLEELGRFFLELRKR